MTKRRPPARAEAARPCPGLRVREYWGQTRINVPARIILAMPHLPGWAGRVGWTVGEDGVNVAPGAGVQAYRDWKRLRRALPAPGQGT